MSQGKRKQVPYVLGQAWETYHYATGPAGACAYGVCGWGEPTAGARSDGPNDTWRVRSWAHTGTPACICAPPSYPPSYPRFVLLEKRGPSYPPPTPSYPRCPLSYTHGNSACMIYGTPCIEMRGDNN